MTVETIQPSINDELRDRFDVALAEFLDKQEPQWSAGPLRDVLSILREFVLAGGKRLRPAFCYWGWRGAGGQDGPEVIAAAAALELFHAFGLIHDDIIDDSDHRRGQPSVHQIFADLHIRSAWRGTPATFGRNAALLCGDLCAAWADQMFQECGLPSAHLRRAYGEFAEMRTEVIAGQYLDVVSGVSEGSIATALTVIRMKTARYTVTRPLRIGARLAGADTDLCVALGTFGDPLGDAFQLRDDVLGVFGDPTTLGKSTLDDLREGKPTVMMTIARGAADHPQAARLGRLFGNPTLDANGAAELRDIIVSTGALDQVERMIQERASAAGAALAAIPLADSTRQALSALAAAVVDRQH